MNVSGTVGNARDPSDAPEEVQSFTWRVIGMPKLTGEIPFSKEGSFRFSFPTAGISGAAVLELQAADKNGRVATRALTLIAPARAASSSSAALVLSLSSPADNSVFGSVVTVAGKVSSPASDPVASVTWSIAGTPLSGSADVGAGGSFSFPVKTSGLHGTQALNLTASSAAGLTAQRTVVLMDSGKGVQISLSSPTDGGYYRDLTVFDGRVGDDAAQVKSFAYEVVGVSGLAGRVAPQPDGRFKFVLSLGNFSGDVKVRLTAVDVSSRQVQSIVVLHDGNLRAGRHCTAPSQGSAFGSTIRVAGAVKDPFTVGPAWRASTPSRGSSLPSISPAIPPGPRHRGARTGRYVQVLRADNGPRGAAEPHPHRRRQKRKPHRDERAPHPG